MTRAINSYNVHNRQYLKISLITNSEHNSPKPQGINYTTNRIANDLCE